MPGVEIGNATTGEGHGLLRIEPDRLVKIRDRPVVLSLERINVAAAVECEDKFRVEADRFVEIGDGAVILVFAPISEAAVVEGGGEFRIEVDASSKSAMARSYCALAR